MIVLWVLYHVPPSDELITVVAVLLVCEEVCLAQKLLLVMLEFSHHLVESRKVFAITIFSKIGATNEGVDPGFC
jgi:hypothetical protein